MVVGVLQSSMVTGSDQVVPTPPEPQHRGPVWDPGGLGVVTYRQRSEQTRGECLPVLPRHLLGL